MQNIDKYFLYSHRDRNNMVLFVGEKISNVMFRDVMNITSNTSMKNVKNNQYTFDYFFNILGNKYKILFPIVTSDINQIKELYPELFI